MNQPTDTRMAFLIVSTLIAAAIVIFLTGCVSTNDPTASLMVKEKTMEVIQIKEDLLLPCARVRPPKPLVYLAGSKDEREDMMIRYSAEQITSIHDCSSDKTAIRKIQQQQIEAVNQFNQKEKERVEALQVKLKKGVAE